jgi:hypothetical protein
LFLPGLFVAESFVAAADPYFDFHQLLVAELARSFLELQQDPVSLAEYFVRLEEPHYYPVGLE